MAKRVTKPSFKPTDADRERVKLMAAVGIPQDDIRKTIGRPKGIGLMTLHKYFRDELDLGMIEANAQVGATLFQKALSGDTTAMIFWAKTRMGFKETSVTEHAAGDNTEVRFGMFIQQIEDKRGKEDPAGP